MFQLAMQQTTNGDVTTANVSRYGVVVMDGYIARITATNSRIAVTILESPPFILTDCRFFSKFFDFDLNSRYADSSLRHVTLRNVMLCHVTLRYVTLSSNASRYIICCFVLC